MWYLWNALLGRDEERWCQRKEKDPGDLQGFSSPG